MSYHIDTNLPWVPYSPTYDPNYSPIGYPIINSHGFVMVSPQENNKQVFNKYEIMEQGEWTKKKDAILSCFCCNEKIYNNHICNGDDKNNCDCASKIRVKNGYIFPICKECSELTTELAETLFGKSQIHKGRLYGVPVGREISHFILYTLAESFDNNFKRMKVDESEEEINEKFLSKDDKHIAHGFDVEKIEIGFCGVCGFKNESKGSYLDVHQESVHFCPICNNQTLVKTKCWVIQPEVCENRMIIKRNMTDSETLLSTDENDVNALLPINDFKRKRNCFNRPYCPSNWNCTNNDNKAVKIATSLIIRKYKELEKIYGNDKILIDVNDNVKGSEIITKHLGLVKRLSFENNQELVNIENNSQFIQEDNIKDKKRLSPVSVVGYFEDDYDI